MHSKQITDSPSASSPQANSPQLPSTRQPATLEPRGSPLLPAPRLPLALLLPLRPRHQSHRRSGRLPFRELSLAFVGRSFGLFDGVSCRGV